MTWQLVHHYAGSPCSAGVPIRPSRWVTQARTLGRTKRLTVRKRRQSCPFNNGSTAGSALGPAITALLHRRGIDYEPVGPANSLLWCMGGPPNGAAQTPMTHYRASQSTSQTSLMSSTK